MAAGIASQVYQRRFDGRSIRTGRSQRSAADLLSEAARLWGCGRLAVQVVGLGLWLLPLYFELVWVEIGSGPDLYIMGWKVFIPLRPIIVVLAVLSSLLPALRAARLEVTGALRYE